MLLGFYKICEEFFWLWVQWVYFSFNFVLMFYNILNIQNQIEFVGRISYGLFSLFGYEMYIL